MAAMSILSAALQRVAPRTAASRPGPIGIDFSLESMHVVQLEHGTDRMPATRARVSIPFDAPRQEVVSQPLLFRSLMKRALEADRFAGRKAVIAVPSGMFRTMSVNFKSGPGAQQEAAAILKIMKSRLDGDLADYVIDYMPVRNRSQKDEKLALVAVSERKPIIDLLEMARKSRLDVQALEIGPVSICRLVAALSLQTGDENVLVINSGRRASYITLISGSDLLFDQEVSFGENSLIEQTATTLDMPKDMARDLILRTGVRTSSDADSVRETIDETGLVNTLAEILKPRFLKLVEEIKRVCLYAAAETRGGAVSRVYLLGSIARWPGADQLLGRLTGTQVSNVPDPLILFPSSEADATRASSSAPEIAVATGAALRGFRANA